MNKQQFLAAVKAGISSLPQSDIDKTLDYYDEMIADRMEDGMTEEEAVSDLGSVEEIVSQFMGETREVRESSMPVWAVILLVIGIPVWLPLFVGIGIAVLSVYAALWMVLISLYVTGAALAISCITGILLGVCYLVAGKLSKMAFFIGLGLVCGGLGIGLYFLCNGIAKGLVMLGRWSVKGVKSIFGRKEAKS